METLTVGILADPGLPEKTARSLVKALSTDLGSQAGSEVEWAVEVSQESLPVTAQGNVPLLEHAEQLRAGHGWDQVIYLTDLPRSQGRDILLCEYSAAHRAALVSLPALGVWRVGVKVRRLITDLVPAAQDGANDRPNSFMEGAGPRLGIFRPTSLSQSGDASYVLLPGHLNAVFLVAGMVLNNRPGRLLKALAGCIAAAAATGAFGIFYASVWNMSDALHPSRLASISLVVISALSSWLILHNRMWDGVRGSSVPRLALRDNIATIITVWLGTAMMYLLIWGLLFILGLAVIAADYLQSQLGHPVSLLDYGHLSWLAASLGTLAGALGSNFDSDAAIREATYSRREHQRRQLADDEQD